MREQPSSRRDPAPLLPFWRRTGWIMAALMLLAFVVGAGVGAWLVPTHQPTSSAGSPACPSSARNVTWPSPPMQVVSYNPPSSELAPVTLQPSQTLEVDLFGPWIWQLRTPDVSPTLALETPAGYLSGQVCVWRFTAQQVGREQVLFTGGGMCHGTAETCVAFRFTLTVTVAAGSQVSARVQERSSSESRAGTSSQAPFLWRSLPATFKSPLG